MTARTPTTPQLVTPYPYPASLTHCAAIDRLIMAEVMTCPNCCREYSKGRLIRECRECGCARDRGWWERIVRIAGEEVGEHKRLEEKVKVAKEAIEIMGKAFDDAYYRGEEDGL
jgi:hypothetical protein